MARQNKQLSYCRETTLHYGLVMTKSGKMELGDNKYGHYRSIFNHRDVTNWPAKQPKYVKKAK